MNVILYPGPVRGVLSAVSSKSQAHRLLICAALADRPTQLLCRTTSQDIDATCRCLQALGAGITRTNHEFHITPIDRNNLPQTAVLDCGESGSTLRFLLPVAAALGIEATFLLTGRLPHRPLHPLDAQLEAHGCRLNRPEETILSLTGQLRAGAYTLPGNVSSQYITGLLFALPLLGAQSTLTITDTLESREYVTMTLEALAAFSVQPEQQDTAYRILPHAYRSTGRQQVEGDWSNAAFWLCAGAMSRSYASLTGLRLDSAQGDRMIADILVQMGARLEISGDTVAVWEQKRRAITLDAAPIPDLIPTICAVAAVSRGTTVIENAGRLRLKESDRLQTTANALRALGADIDETENGLIIHGVRRLKGGRVDACGDHRIAMMAAVASCACEAPVTVIGSEAVKKSYPAFWQDLAAMGKRVEWEVLP